MKAIDRFTSKTKPSGECVVWTGARNSEGYGYFKADGKDWRSTRWIFLHDHGYLPPVVMHTCDNPQCVNLRHLIPGTQAENMLDKMAKGRWRGGRKPSKLTSGQVAEIRSRATQVPQKVLAEAYGVHPSHISRIVNNKNRIEGDC